MYALVTGASSGVGLWYAETLAKRYRYDLLLVSNQEKEIQQTAQRLSALYGITAYGIYKDLSLSQAAEELYGFCREHALQVDVLINNAGVFYMKRLTQVEPRRIETMLMLHVVTLTNLCRLFGADMCSRGKGYILNMASMTAWMAMPGIQCYNATKAFVLNLSKSLWYEFKPFGVGVTVMTPGAIDTGLYSLSPSMRRRLVRSSISIPPQRFAEAALKAMFRKKKQAMPGLLNHLFVPIMNHLPDWVVFLCMKRLAVFR